MDQFIWRIVNIEWMSKHFNFVGKQINRANVPQARPIESFWDDLAQKVYSADWEAKTREQRVDRITFKILTQIISKS